ncbi:MAG: hypothetical protein HLUCCA11_03210 [Phormidesmis priestleyi Ana]|uniref:Uncharacterized protein n=1 Tax=Phormidesmis priestleyi Ana TaxID=1666911 RepID=A0A0P8C5E3_9CYAN|nr:MAG: hypothetical protein HLUCCA11_03210 [Phormidesmis priestleyi Ana]
MGLNILASSFEKMGRGEELNKKYIKFCEFHDCMV